MNGIGRQDLVLIASLLGAALLLAAVFSFRGNGREAAGSVTARVDGKIMGSWSLSEDGEYEIRTEYGRNLIRIRDGRADMEEADCPEGYCMKQKPLEKSGDLLVCLPHHLIVRAEKEAGTASQETAVDAVAGRTSP